MTSPASSNRRIAVIGGGISGLAAAWQLQTSAPDIQFTLFEAASRLGGMIETRTVAGHTFECGPDSILRRMPDGLALCHELKLDDELVGTNPNARGVYSVHHGRLVRVPDGLATLAPSRMWQMVITPLVSLAGKLRMWREASVPRRDPALGDESLAEFARRRVGREAFERIVQPLAGGIFMGDPERLSLPACFPQFAKLEAEHGSLSLAMSKQRSVATGQTEAESIFFTHEHGLEYLVATLADALPRESLQADTRVTGLTRKDNSWQLTVAGGAEHAFAGVIVATPARAAARLLADVDTQAADLLAGINSSNCVIVVVAAKRSDVRHPLDASGFVVPLAEGRAAAACTFSSSKYTGRAPDDEVTFRVFLGGPSLPDACDLDDPTLTLRAVGELHHLVGLSAAPLWTVVVRWPESMPQYELGHLARIAELESRIRELPGLALAGNAYRGVGIPYCIRSGRTAAEQLLQTVLAGR